MGLGTATASISFTVVTVFTKKRFHETSMRVQASWCSNVIADDSGRTNGMKKNHKVLCVMLVPSAVPKTSTLFQIQFSTGILVLPNKT